MLSIQHWRYYILTMTWKLLYWKAVTFDCVTLNASNVLCKQVRDSKQMSKTPFSWWLNFNMFKQTHIQMWSLMIHTDVKERQKIYPSINPTSDQKKGHIICKSCACGKQYYVLLAFCKDDVHVCTFKINVIVKQNLKTLVFTTVIFLFMMWV